MIRVTVELISAIDPSRNQTLGVAVIANDGTGSATRGNYTAQFYGGTGGFGKQGHVENYPRKAVSIWNLLRRSIEAAGYTK